MKKVIWLIFVLVITIVAYCGRNKKIPQENTTAMTTVATVATVATEQENIKEWILPVETPPTRPIEIHTTQPVETLPVASVEITTPKDIQSTHSDMEITNSYETMPPATEDLFDLLGENQTPPAIRE